MVQLPEMPDNIAALPRDDRGYPVPWFVSWIEGKPEFRVADGRKWARAVKRKLCWVCGQKLEPNGHVFPIGPMCAVNRTTAEPPCHRECAEFSAMACPFLSMPKAKRREANMPDGACGFDALPGHAIKRNPGVVCLWFCRGYEMFDDGRGGMLFSLPNPSKVKWFAEGRKATRAEILESIETGLPILRDMAVEEGPRALAELERVTEIAMRLVPAA